jgi:hypothetical protein
MERVILKRLVVTLIAVWSIVFASQALASSSAKFTNPDKSISTYTANPDGSTTLVESETDGTINTYLNGNRLTVKSPDDTIFDTIVNSDGSRDTAVTYPGQPRLVLATIPIL